MNNDDISHDGHRARLLDLAYNAGLDNMSDVQCIEFMLTYIFPRGDVNPLAHRLLKAYDNFENIIEASVADLMTIKGINERSAKKIVMLFDMFFTYSTAKLRSGKSANTTKELVDTIETMLRFRKTENLLLLAFGRNNTLCGHKRICSSSSGEVSIPVLELSGFLSATKPVSFAMAHCHPFGSAKPSGADGDAFELAERICFDCGVKFIDGFIVGDEGIYSQRNKTLVRAFYNIDNIPVEPLAKKA